MKIRQTKLTKFARGKPCTLRVAGYGRCGSPETSVFCHAPAAPIHKGKSIKSHDSWGAIGCFPCHQLMDDQRKIDEMTPALVSEPAGNGMLLIRVVNVVARQRYLTDAEKAAAWLRGIHETQTLMFEAGLLEAHL